jgi:hypothetical protein
MRAKRHFAEEVRHRQTEIEHTVSLSQGQRYVLRELRVMFGLSVDEDERAQINLLERAFRGPLSAALTRELNRLRRNGVAGSALLKTLGRLYLEHGMRDWVDRRAARQEGDAIPRIVCSEGLV